MTNEEYRRNKRLEEKEKLEEIFSYFLIASFIGGVASLTGFIFGGVDTLKDILKMFMIVYFIAFAVYIGSKTHVLAAVLFIALVWILCDYVF